MRNVFKIIVHGFNLTGLLGGGLLMVIGCLYELLGEAVFSRLLETIGLSWNLGKFQVFSLIFLAIWFLMMYVENKFL